MPAKRQLSPEAERLLDARNEAVAELKAIDGQDRDILDPCVIRLSVARLFEQSVTMRILAGEPVASSELQSATRMVADARAAIPPAPFKVELVIVERSADELTDEQGKPLKPRRTTPKLLPPPVTIDAEVVQASNDATVDVSARPAAPVYPRKNPGSIHDAPGARMRRTDYSAINGSAYSPLEARPDFEAKHPVPERFWPGPFGS